jgi:hypothetical protein
MKATHITINHEDEQQGDHLQQHTQNLQPHPEADHHQHSSDVWQKANSKSPQCIC